MEVRIVTFLFPMYMGILYFNLTKGTLLKFVSSRFYAQIYLSAWIKEARDTIVCEVYYQTLEVSST